jgi:hypothetical protein
MNEFDDAILRRGAYILNRDRSDSFNAFKNKSPGLLGGDFDESPPHVSPVLTSQLGLPSLPFATLGAFANPI